MGNCLFLEEKKRRGSIAFQREFDISAHISSIPPDTKIYVVTVLSASDLPSSDIAGEALSGGLADPIVRLFVKPDVENIGNQSQRTSRLVRTLNPVWNPPETFQFIILDSSAKIVLSAISRNGKRKAFLGDAVLNIADVRAKHADSVVQSDSNQSNPTGIQQDEPFVLPLFNPSTGRRAGHVTVRVSVQTVDQVLSAHRHVVHEYQRYQVSSLSWGNSPDCMLPTDPGRFANADRTSFSNDFEDVAPPVPEGWVVRDPWSTQGGAQTSGDWLYAVDFKSKAWHPEAGNTLFVRRRTWERRVARITTHNDDQDNSDDPGKQSVSVPDSSNLDPCKKADNGGSQL